MNNPFENVDINQIIDRYEDIVVKYVNLAAELAPKLEKFGKYREEIQYIIVELNKRGFNPKDPSSLENIIKSELQKRKINEDGTQTDTPTGYSEPGTDIK